MRLFVIFWISLSLLTVYYIGRRLITPIDVFRAWQKKLAWAVLIFFFIIQISAQWMHRAIFDPQSNLQSILYWASYISMGYLALILFSLLAVDLLRVVLSPGVPAVRSFFYKLSPSFFSLFILSFCGVGLVIGLFQALQRVPVKEVSVPIKGLHPDLVGFRIVQITDLHVGPLNREKFVRQIVETVNALRPDFVALTGDVIDGTVKDLRPFLAPLRELKSTYGTYYCTGNHEFYWGVGAWLKEFSEMGMKVLTNSNETVQKGHARVLVAGVHDYHADRIDPRYVSDPILALGKGEADLKILLAHQPGTLLRAGRLGYHLQLSGHTHGGQFIPWSFLVRFAHPYYKGLHEHDSETAHQTWIYVSHGTGYWGPPLRLGVPPEITLLVLEAV